MDDVGIHVTTGGEAVRVTRSLPRAPCRPACCRHAFFVRDRLGQIIFSDDTFGTSDKSADIPADCVFVACFAFVLPYLAHEQVNLCHRGVLFGTQGEHGRVLIQKRVDKEFLYIQSNHISNAGDAANVSHARRIV